MSEKEREKMADLDRFSTLRGEATIIFYSHEEQIQHILFSSDGDAMQTDDLRFEDNFSLVWRRTQIWVDQILILKWNLAECSGDFCNQSNRWDV